MSGGTMSPFEMAILAAQTRANLARLRDFTTFQPDDEKALDRVDALLVDIIQPFAPATASAPAHAEPVTPVDPQEEAGTKAFELLRAAHPQHVDRMSSLMWMGMAGDVHVFKHSNTRRSMAFNPVTRVVSGTLETGETSHDAGEVLREIATL